MKAIIRQVKEFDLLEKSDKAFKWALGDDLFNYLQFIQDQNLEDRPKDEIDRIWEKRNIR